MVNRSGTISNKIRTRGKSLMSNVKLSLLFIWVFASCNCYAQTEKPNVLFIAVDDLNDWIGCLDGHPQALTPNMDRLASRGVLFANAHCAAPACNPSRAAVFCGRLPQVSGVWSNKSKSISQYKAAILIPTALNQSGYRTLGTGKLLHKGGKSAFQEYYSVEQRWSPFSGEAVQYKPEELSSKGTENPRHRFRYKGKEYTLPLNNMPSDRAPNQRKGESFDWGPIDVPDSEFGDTQITNWAIQQVRTKHDKPLFLGVGYYRPHIPLWAPKRFFGRFARDPGKLPVTKPNDLEDLGSMGRKWALEPITAGSHATVIKNNQWQAAVEAYLACVSYVDHEIGRLLEALDDSRLAQNTLVILWSDHGWQLGEKQHWGKWTGWERSTKVPLIVVPPQTQANQFSKGAICRAPVSLLDVYPTLMEFCDGHDPPTFDGQSLVPLLKTPSLKTDRAAVTMFDKGNGAIRTNHFRYIEYANGEHELYHMDSDPYEFENLASNPKYDTTKRLLQSQLAPYLNQASQP